MTDHDLNILFITETWLYPIDFPYIAAFNTPPYCFIHNPHNSPHPGGGTGLLYKYSLIISNISYHSFSHSEALSCAISSPFSRTFNIFLFYRPTSPTINSFLDELSLFKPTITSNIIILSDFNIPNPPMIQSLNKLLTSFNLVLNVTTLVHGNTLDIIISPKTNKIVTDHSIGPLFSDHFLIFLTLSHPKPTRPLTTRISCKLHSLPIPAFIFDLSSLPTSTSAELHTSFSSTLDKYAPLFTKTSITRPDSSWYSISLLKQKRILHKSEKSYLKHPSPTSLAYYNNLKNLHQKAISTTKASHITHKFDKLTNNCNSIHGLSAQLLGRSLKSPLPTVTPEELPLLFDKSFNDKLSTTFSTFPTLVILTTPITFPASLEKFESPPLDQIISLLKSTSSTSSLDPLPLPILKQIINTVATPLHQIICGSLSSGSIPPNFKKAVITPILKKLQLDSLSPPTTLPPFSIYTHPLLQSTPDPPTPFSLQQHIYTTSTPPIYASLPYLPLIIGTPYPTTFE